MAICPVCGMEVDEKSVPSMKYKGTRYYFMNKDHKKMFKKDPEKYLAMDHSDHGDHAHHDM